MEALKERVTVFRVFLVLVHGGAFVAALYGHHWDLAAWIAIATMYAVVADGFKRAAKFWKDAALEYRELVEGYAKLVEKL